MRPFQGDFTFENMKKSHGATSGEYIMCSYIGICFLAKSGFTHNAVRQDEFSYYKIYMFNRIFVFLRNFLL